MPLASFFWRSEGHFFLSGMPEKMPQCFHCCGMGNAPMPWVMRQPPGFSPGLGAPIYLRMLPGPPSMPHDPCCKKAHHSQLGMGFCMTFGIASLNFKAPYIDFCPHQFLVHFAVQTNGRLHGVTVRLMNSLSSMSTTISPVESRKR